MKFRELDRTWIAFDKKKEIKKIAKMLKFHYEDGILLGYSYISHEEGLKIKIAGFIVKEDQFYFLDSEILHKDLTISFHKKLNYHVVKVPEGVTDKIQDTKIIENDVANYYQKASLIEARKLENIDEFRDEVFIDDIEILLKNKKKEEYLWGRIEDCSTQNMIFVCSLLEDSKINPKYKKDTLVLVKMEGKKKDFELVIDGIVVKK
jgi:hypothetical protein